MFMTDNFSFFKNLFNKDNFSNKFMNKSSFWILFLRLYIFITATICPYFGDMINNFVSSNNNAFVYFFISLFLTNMLIHKYFRASFITIDLALTYLLFFIKNVRLFIDFLLIRFKKISFFLINSKFRKFTNLLNFVKIKTCALFYLWRPLFKRFSYFGNFKLTRTKNYKNN